MPYLKMSICADVLDIYQEIIEKNENYDILALVAKANLREVNYEH